MKAEVRGAAAAQGRQGWTANLASPGGVSQLDGQGNAGPESLAASEGRVSQHLVWDFQPPDP